MHPLRIVALIVLPALAAVPVASTLSAPADGARRAPRYFDLVNASHDGVISVAVAPAGQDAFEDIVFDAPLHGGVTSTTVGLPEGGCLRDFRITFDDGRKLLYPRIDTCRYRQLRLTPRDGKQRKSNADYSVPATS